MVDLIAGIYQHYKGNLYQVLGLASDANADTLGLAGSVSRVSYMTMEAKPLGERIVVVYIGLQLDGASFGPRMHVRTLEDFTINVCGDPEHPGFGKVLTGPTTCTTPRFKYLGSGLTEEMLP